MAASLQPCVAPGTTDVQAPFEAQGRGFAHGHGKGHSVIGPTMAWLRSAVVRGLRSAALGLRTALLSTAVTVQYEAANEPARQLGLPDVAPEPFTARQQRQSRMDGGEEEDGTLREEVALGPPVEQPYLVEERARGGRGEPDACSRRCSVPGAPAHRGLPVDVSELPPADQFRAPRWRSSACHGSQAARHGAVPEQRFTVDEDGAIVAVLKKKLEAKESLRSTRTP